MELFNVSCPKCGKEFKDLKIGINSYLEMKCSKCKKVVFVKTTKKGIKSNIKETVG